MSDPIFPRARLKDLLFEELDDELLVYDNERHTANRLNRTAGAVLQSSDGKHSVADLVQVLHGEVGELADEDLVMVTLDRLNDSGLIESGYPRRNPDEVRFSRRRFIRRAGVVGAAALALPMIHSVPAAKADAAQSNDYYCYIYSCGEYYCSCGCSCGYEYACGCDCDACNGTGAYCYYCYSGSHDPS